jgi:hypothetical protein
MKFKVYYQLGPAWTVIKQYMDPNTNGGQYGISNYDVDKLIQGNIFTSGNVTNEEQAREQCQQSILAHHPHTPLKSWTLRVVSVLEDEDEYIEDID